MIAMARRNWVLFAIIIAAAIVLRFYGLLGQGFLYWDEGMYMNEAKFYASLVEHRAFILEQLQQGPDIEMIKSVVDGWPSSAVKPLHGLLIYGMSLVIGLHDYTGQVMSALFSIVMLWLVFFMVAKYESVFTAFFALILLAFSPFHIMFSRAAFPEMDSVVFYLIATLFYLAYIEGGRKSVWKMLGVGVFFGMSLTTNYRWFMMFPVFFLAEIFIKGDPLLYRLRRWFVMVAGLMAVVLAMDMPYKLFLPANSVPVEFASFKEQLLYYIFKIFSEHQLALFGFRPLYLRLYGEFNGFMSTGFLLLGTAFLLRKRRTFFMNYSLLVFYFVLLGLTFVKKGQFARYDSIIYPFGAIITAYGITGFCRGITQKRWLRKASVIVLALFITVSGIQEARAIISLRSGYREAKAFLEEHGGQQCLASTNSVFEFYFGRNVANILNREENVFLEDMQKADYKFLVVDYAQLSVAACAPTHIYSYLREHRKPVAVIKNPMGAYLRAVLENIHYVDHPVRPYRELLSDPQIDEIRIYSTEGLVDEIKAKIIVRQA